MRETSSFSSGVVVAAGVCVLVITGIIVRREFGPGQEGGSAGPTVRMPTVELIDSWDELSGVGHRIGAEDAPLTVVVFSDFQCPACRNFARELFPELEERFPGQVSLVFRHWPLDGHSFAYAAARAAECAASEDKFVAYHDGLFANQDSIGLKSFVDVGREVGIENMVAFEACVWSQEPAAAIERDIEAVRELGGVGTPTVIINGLIIRRGMTWELLDSLGAAMLSSAR